MNASKRTESTDESHIVTAQHPPSMRMTTKIQVSGWRFLLRRLSHAIVRRNTAMWDDPGQFYSRATWGGIAVAVVICVACGLLAWLKPQGKVDGAELIADTNTSQLFLLQTKTNQLRPVYNLTSARLIAGQPDNPRRVKSSELDRYQRTQTVGIPGAPWSTPVNQSSVSHWTICDTTTNAQSARAGVSVSVVADPPELSPGTSAPLAPGDAALVTYRGANYLVDKAGRHSIDLANSSITSAIELPPSAATTIPLSEALYNALPAADPIALPTIPGAGDPNSFGLDPAIRVGTVIVDNTTATQQHFVVLNSGVAKVNPTTAAALRNTNSYGFINPPAVTADRIAVIPKQEFHSPLHPVSLINRVNAPVLCWHWTKSSTDSTPPQITVLGGKQIPVAQQQLANPIKQVTTAITVFQTGGRFTQTVGPTATNENKFYIDPGGVRYGVNDPDTPNALGLSNPQPSPWEALRLLAAGPDLTKEAALLEHDTLPPDPQPRAISKP